ncbi:hypothetical protein B0H13DRAFT_1893505 [Mycena leptocephala]|nr:hypothetical protein B0H13DRAFT_1893505 [Mycena leptocephala]
MDVVDGNRNPKHGRSLSSLQAHRNKYLKPDLGIMNDAQRLWMDFRLNFAPAIELGLLAKLAQPEVFHPCAQYACLAGLTDITLQALGRRLDKGPQNSDWSAEYLSDQQLLCNELSSAPKLTIKQ